MMQPLCIPQKNTQTLYIKSDDYTFTTGDTLYFTVKAKPDNDQTDADALVAKTLVFGTDCNYDNEGCLALPLDETDTNLDAGNYTYDIKLVNSDVKDIIVFGPLVILPVDTLRV
jgi:hypothetical protein